MTKNSNQNSFIFASDLDGTIIDHTENKIAAAQREGIHLTSEQVSSETLRATVKKEIRERIQGHVYEEATLSAKPIEGAKEVIESFVKNNGPVYIISARSTKSSEEYAREWLRRNLPAIKQEHVFFVQRGEEKDEVASQLGADFYIDDKEIVLDHLPSVRHKFLFYPFNESANTKYEVVRKWEEVPAKLDRLFRG